MARSNEIDKLAAALSKAQGMIRGAQKDGENPMFKSHYSTLDSIWRACREALAANELAVVQEIETIGPSCCMVTTLMHSSGQWTESRIPFTPPTNQKGTTDIQAAGSYITYLRRYMLAASVGVAPTDDDDGEQAMQRDYEAGPEEKTAVMLRADLKLCREVPHLERWMKEHSEQIKGLGEPWTTRLRQECAMHKDGLKKLASGVATSQGFQGALDDVPI